MDNTTPTWDQNDPNQTPPSGEVEQEDALSSGDGVEVEETDTPNQIKPGEEVPKGGKSSAQERVNKLLAENKELSEKLDAKGEAERKVPVPTGAPDPQSPESQKLISQIKNLGFVHTDKLDEKVRTMEDRMVLNTEHSRLTDEYSGSDGRPKYDGKAVESYMRENGIYQPEIAYKAMHEKELLDWHMKVAPTQKSKAYSAPPAAPSKAGDGTITREKMSEMQAKGGEVWRAWYEKNRKKILSLMSQDKLE